VNRESEQQTEQRYQSRDPARARVKRLSRVVRLLGGWKGRRIICCRKKKKKKKKEKKGGGVELPEYRSSAA
jgi:hypothetical protein